MGTADHRNNRFEFKSAKQDANGLYIECIERGVYGSPPPSRLIADSEFSPDELAKVVEVLTLLETKFDTKHAAEEQNIDAAKVNAMMRQAKEAEDRAAAAEERAKAAALESARIEAENIVKRVEAEELDANLATLRSAAVEEKRDV